MRSTFLSVVYAGDLLERIRSTANVRMPSTRKISQKNHAADNSSLQISKEREF